MINEEKVIAMTKLAMLEKNNIQKDLRITSYYPEDYVYINNLITRISMFFIVGAMIGVHILIKMEEEIIIPSTGRELFMHYMLPYGTVVLAVLLIYTLISTAAYTRKYQRAEKHVMAYNELLQQLDEEDSQVEVERREADGKRKNLTRAS